jgi:hypothetical protein
MLDSINLLKQRDIRNYCGLGLEPLSGLQISVMQPKAKRETGL